MSGERQNVTFSVGLWSWETSRGGEAVLSPGKDGCIMQVYLRQSCGQRMNLWQGWSLMFCRTSTRARLAALRITKASISCNWASGQSAKSAGPGVGPRASPTRNCLAGWLRMFLTVSSCCTYGVVPLPCVCVRTPLGLYWVLFNCSPWRASQPAFAQTLPGKSGLPSNWAPHALGRSPAYAEGSLV